MCHHHLPTGWSKASLSVDASEENDGYSSGEDPMNSDPEDDVGKKLVRLNPEFFLFTGHSVSHFACMCMLC